MLLDSVRTWLNSLPDNSINAWIDFEQAFVRNFTGTYKRPGWPRELALFVQGPDESDRSYITRWTSMHNSCEGVHKHQAVDFFINGCRDDTMLKHKLR